MRRAGGIFRFLEFPAGRILPPFGDTRAARYTFLLALNSAII